MKKIILLLVAGFFLSSVHAQTRKEFLLEKNWKFSKGDFPTAIEPTFDDSKWENVVVPHDWAIYGPFDKNNDIQKAKIVQNGEKEETEKTGRTGALPYMGVAWYRTKFEVPDFKEGKKVTILFDGAMSNAHVYINGKEVGSWAYGYNSFYFDITSFLKKGEKNTLSVRLENKPFSSRWYPGAGLYRNVHIIITDQTNVKTWGTYITTPTITTDLAIVNVKTSVDNSAKKSLRLETEIFDNKGNRVAKTSSTDDYSEFNQDIKVRTPQLWSPETPVLYTAVSKLYSDNELKDETKTTFGIRSIKLEQYKGFSLNGKYRKFKGVCLHHDLGAIGTAINVSAIRRQLTILKDMGCDAIRTSHNMPAPELLQLCDEMGFMVMCESFDAWVSPKVENGYNTLFKDWAEKDMVNFIHRDRNHACVVMWSVGNEIGEQGMANGQKIAKFLVDICHREDPTRPVCAGMDRIDGALKNNFASVFDVAGFNYKPHKYAEAQKSLPQGIILGSETASTISSRGVYKFPLEFTKEKQYPDNQCCSYDFGACSWSQVPDDEFVMQDSLEYVIGEFVWTGFDYLGEPTPYDSQWSSRSSYFGIVDLAGIPKDRFYLYRSKWNPNAETLHLLPHWNWEGREGQVTPVFCYTNYPSAELFVNGKSMGKQTKNNSTRQNRYRLMWKDVKYEKGSIKVVAYDKDGKAVAQKEIFTAGKPHHIELVADRKMIAADGKELSFVTAKIVDEKGNLCPDADNSLSFEVKGEGKYRAVCNGDATSLELFHLPHMKVFKGMLVALVQSTEKAGKMTLEVKSKGLKSATIEIQTK